MVPRVGVRKDTFFPTIPTGKKCFRTTLVQLIEDAGKPSEGV
jgi:hypothetical protein